MANEPITVITGASRGLGRAASRHLAMKGHRVIATGRDAEALETLRAESEADGHRLECHRLDVTDDRSVGELRGFLEERHGRVDVLINNAGIGIDKFSARLLELPLETLRATLETNLYGVLRVTQALLPLMRNSHAGRVVNVSSGMGQLSDMEAGAPAYRISKTALNAVTRILAIETADQGIKVNSVCPGWCRTDLGGPNAPRSAEEGIDTIVWLATLPDDGPSGGFFRDRRPIPW